MTLGRFLLIGDIALCIICLAGAATGQLWLLLPAAFVGFAAYALINGGAWSER